MEGRVLLLAWEHGRDVVCLIEPPFPETGKTCSVKVLTKRRLLGWK
jgi:hypothetical protein